MAKTKVSEFDAVASNNTDINSVNVAEGCPPSGINNAIREMASLLKKQEVGTDAMTSPDINGGTIDGATIGGSSGVTIGVSDGTVSAPSIKFTSDTNTGIYRGGTDILKFVTAGTDAITIDASQLIGIGTSSPSSYNSSFNNLVVADAGDSGITIVTGTSSEGSIAFADGTTGADAYRGWINYNHFSNYMRIFTNGTEAMRIDNNGSVSIGHTSTGGANFAICDGANSAIQFFPEISTDTNLIQHYDQTATAYMNSEHRANSHIFKIGTSNAVKIDSSGNLLVGKTSSGLSNAGVSFLGGSNVGTFEVRRNIATANSSSVGYISRGTTDGSLLKFYRGTTAVGDIGVSNSDQLTIGTSDGSEMGLRFDGDLEHILPTNATGAKKDALADLGSATARWRNIYLSGGVYLGGTGSANKLDDYEEGTWTPAFNLVTVTHTEQYGRYVKIGKIVYCKAKITVSSIDNTDPSGVQMTVPFTANSSAVNGGRGCLFSYDGNDSSLIDGSHADMQGAYVSGTTFAITDNTGGTTQYSELTQTSGSFVFAFSFEAT
jgi:hypothetical protein